MEQAYGFTPTHTEQYISPTAHRYKKYNFHTQASTRTKLLAEILAHHFLVCIAFPFLYFVSMLKYSDMQIRTQVKL